MEIHTGDIVRLRKKHPCGGDEWQILSSGVDVKIICLTCKRRILMERSLFERSIKAFLSRGGIQETN